MKLELVLDDAAPTWRPGADWKARARAMVGRAGPRDGWLQVVLTGDAQLQVLNRRYRKQDRPTDVLSFSYLTGHRRERERLLQGHVLARPFCDEPLALPGPVLVGQVLVSLDTVAARNEGKRRAAESDLLLMVAHGLLHVLGYDHRDDADADEMEHRQQELLRRARRAKRGQEAVGRA